MHPRRWQGSAWQARLRLESGQTMAEYATLLGVLIIAIVVIFGAFSVGINNKLQNDLTTILSGM
jgi:Flp pilus assembly pilin Flp